MRNEKKEFRQGLDGFIDRLETYKVSHEELLEFTAFLIAKLKERKLL